MYNAIEIIENKLVFIFSMTISDPKKNYVPQCGIEP